MFSSMATDAPELPDTDRREALLPPAPAEVLLSASWQRPLAWARDLVAVWPFSSMTPRWALALLAAVFLAISTPAMAAPEASAAPTWTDDLEAVAPAVPRAWTTVKGPYLRVHGHPNELDTLVRVANHGSEALPRLANQLDLPIGGTIDVYVVDSDATFRSLQPGAPPLWADAVAYPALGAIYLRDPEARGGNSKPLEQVFEHELVHIVLGRGFAPSVPPSWLQEGVAQVLAGESGPETSAQIRDGIAQGGLIPLAELEHGFPRDANRARLAYAESADFVAWLQAQHGPDVVQQLVASTREGAEMPAAIRKATGQLLDDVEATWAERFPSRWTLGSVNLLGDTFLLGMGGILLAVGGYLRKRRFHERMEELAREEALVDEMVARMAARRGRGPTPAPAGSRSRTGMPGAWTS